MIYNYFFTKCSLLEWKGVVLSGYYIDWDFLHQDFTFTNQKVLEVIDFF